MTEALSIHIPHWLHEIRKVWRKSDSFSWQRGRKTQRRKKRITNFPHQSGVGQRAGFPGPDYMTIREGHYPGSCTSSCVSWPFLFPQVVNITDLEGLVLGQAFSIQWDLPVGDLQKFNCFPEQPTVSQESCRERGCLWEVRTRSRLPQWAGSCKKCSTGNWVPRKHFPNVDRLNCNHLQEANVAMAADEVFLSVVCDRRSVFHSEIWIRINSLTFLQSQHFKSHFVLNMAVMQWECTEYFKWFFSSSVGESKQKGKVMLFLSLWEIERMKARENQWFPRDHNKGQ